MKRKSIRCPALAAAIQAVGGYTELTRRINAGRPERERISLQAVWQWRRCPAERVLQVEAITGVSRYRLRPDIYGEAPPDRSA